MIQGSDVIPDLTLSPNGSLAQDLTRTKMELG
jgi:hypothetical protein